MGTKWSDALGRVATAIGRRHSAADGEVPELADESGFTLIELMVVLVIMGILMAIAIPTFLGVTSTANDTSTQSNLSNVITSAKAIYAKADSYPKTATMATDLQKDEPEFKFTATTGTKALTSSAKQDTIAVATTATKTGTKFVAVAYMTKTKECWIAEDTAQVGVKYGFVKPASGTTVTATACKPTASSVTWSTTNGWPGAPAGH
ncbi:MAG: type II secretion system protein [Actinomycetota bacterium]|nr:type II secretion system protein [Actinomycetota bacterium]